MTNDVDVGLEGRLLPRRAPRDRYWKPECLWRCKVSLAIQHRTLIDVQDFLESGPTDLQQLRHMIQWSAE